MLELPISSDAPHFSQEHLIFGRHYVIEFEWIEREDYWVMHFYDASEQPIALGLRVMPNWPIFVEKGAGIAFILVAKTRNAQLTRDTLYTDFIVVVHVFII